MTDDEGVSVLFPTWRVNEAVRKSLTMPPPSRLIMLTLSDLADSATGEVPASRARSLAELAGETGLGLATVKRHLDLLEAEGWLERIRPTDAERVRRVRSRYRLLIPQGSDRAQYRAQGEPGHGSEVAETGFTVSPAQGSERADIPPTQLTVSPDRAHSDTEQGSERATDTAHSGPSFNALSDGSDHQDEEHQPPRKRSGRRNTQQPPAEPDPDTVARDTLARQIVAWWWDQLAIKPAGKQAWHASVRIVANLLAVGHEPKAVATAARAIGVPLSTPAMERELGRMHRAAGGHNGQQPRRATVDERAEQADQALAELKADLAAGASLFGRTLAAPPQRPALDMAGAFREIEP